MDPEPSHWLLSLSIACLSLAFVHTLARQLYPALCRHFHPDPSEKDFFERISKIGNSDHFIETISLARVHLLILGSWSAYLAFQSATVSRHWVIFPIAFAYFIFGLYLPRILALWKTHTLAPWVHRIYQPIWTLTHPLGYLLHQLQDLFYKLVGFDPQFSFLTEEEQKQIDAENDDHQEGLEEDERRMIRNIIEFGETPVQEIMTPRPDIVAIDIRSPLEEVIKVLNTERHSRVPVYKETIDNIIGILHTKDFLEWYSQHPPENFRLRSLIRPPILVSHREKIDDLMRELRLSSNHIAVVVDEYGGTDGIITLEDILEEIVGDIYDEDDEEDGRIQQIQDFAWIVQGSTTIDDLVHVIHHPLSVAEELEIETLGGLIQVTIGGIPRKGQQIEIQGLRAKVLQIKNQRIERVLLEKPLAEDS